MNNPPAPQSSQSENNDNNPPPVPPLTLETAESALNQYEQESITNQEQLTNCEEFTMKLDNEYYNHHKILIELITESKKLLIKYKTGDNDYYYLGEYISSVLDKPNCNNPTKPYKNYTDFLKDYRPTLKVKIDDKDEEIQLMDFRSVDDLKESIIPFNSGEKYLGDRGRIVGLKLPPIIRPTSFGGKKGGKKGKKKKKKNNKTNRRKKKKNGTKKKRN